MRMLHAPQGSINVLNEHAAVDLLNSFDIVRGKWIEFLDSPANLASWAAAAGLLDDATAEQLRRRYARQPELGEAALRDARALRSLLELELAGPAPQSTELQSLLNRLLPSPLLAAGDRLELNAGEDSLLARLALHVVDLLLCVPRERIGRCAAPNCTWFFLDHSGGRRHWCVMQTCGNAAKARRHRERLRQRA